MSDHEDGTHAVAGADGNAVGMPLADALQQIDALVEARLTEDVLAGRLAQIKERAATRSAVPKAAAVATSCARLTVMAGPETGTPGSMQPATSALGTALDPGTAGTVPPDPVLAMARRPMVSVIIPAMNEARNLPHVMARLPRVDEVILVDGGSTDDTVGVARCLMPGIRVVTQNRRGKGNALACGFAAATGDIIVTIAADGSTDPGEIPSFVAALRSGADFAKGSRFGGTGGSAYVTAVRRLGHKGLNSLANVMFGTRYSDLCYGYNAFWAHCLDAFDLDSTSPAPSGRDTRLWGDGAEIDILLNLRAVRARLSIVEVGSFEHGRVHGENSRRALGDGLRVLRTVVRERLRRRCSRTPSRGPGL